MQQWPLWLRLCCHSRGCPLGTTWHLRSCLGHSLPLGSPSSPPAPGLRGPLGRAEPHGGCHLLSSGKSTCPCGHWGQGPALRGLVWWVSFLPGHWPVLGSHEREGCAGGVFLPLLFGPCPVSYGALTGRPWRLQRAVAFPSHPSPALVPCSGPHIPSRKPCGPWDRHTWQRLHKCL